MQPSPSEPERAEDIRVQLKPFFGVSPRVWLPSLYVLLLLALLFFLLVWPGIAFPGTRVTLDSVPSGAAVTWSGKLYGQTPLTVFFPQGTGTLEIAKPGFTSEQVSYTSGGRLFFSLFAPKTDKIELTLQAVSPDSVLSLFRSNLAVWSAAAPFGVDYRFPPLFTRFVEDARAAKIPDGAIRSELFAERRFVADPQMYTDFGRALGLWNNTPHGDLESQFKLWSKTLGNDAQNNGRLLFWVLANQEKTVRDSEVGSPQPFLQKIIQAWQSSLNPEKNVPQMPGSAISAAGSIFRPVPSGSFRWGFVRSEQGLPTEPPFILPSVRTLKGFWMASTETTQAQFSLFLQAHPEWSLENKTNLISAGKVDEGYLANWKAAVPPSPNSPVAEVSWFAAQAYVSWLNQADKIPVGKLAVLPDEVQWEWAAREAKPDFSPIYKKNSSNSLGLAAMLDGVWEWTASSWAPADQLVNEASSPDDTAWFRTLKGGCDENAGKVQVWERGSVAPSTCNSSTGFRVALVSSP